MCGSVLEGVDDNDDDDDDDDDDGDDDHINYSGPKVVQRVAIRPMSRTV